MKKLFTLIIISLLAGQIMAQPEIYLRIKVNIERSAIPDLLATGIPLDNGLFEKDGLILELSAQDLQVLSSHGYDYKILIDDVTRFYQDRNKGFEDLDHVREMSSREITEWPVPEDFELGTCGGFCTIDQMLGHLDNMITKYPNLISTVGQLDYLSHEGREINWVRISDNPNTNEEDEPEILYTGMHHAREPIGMQHLLFFMYHLLENYDTDPEIQYIINNFELYIIPVVSIDGYAYNIANNPNGGGMWRKNRRNNGNGTYGVDLNRNYGYMWGIDNTGSSPDPGDETYRGPAAFSEPETQALRDFCNAHEFQIALNYHSYSNLFLYPWGYTADLPPDNETFHEFSKIMTKENGYTYGPGYTTIYQTNGSSDDWMYGEQTTKDKTLAWTPEVGNSGDGFWPSTNRIIPLCQENMWQSMMATKLCGAYAEVADVSPLILEEQEGTLDAQIKRIGLKDDATYTVEIIPLNDAIESISSAQVFSDLEIFEPQVASFTYTLKSDIQSGDEILYLLSCDNGYYIESDTISKIYGTPLVIFEDTAENFSNWASNKWNITGTSSHSPTKSITDSPSGNYSNYENNIMTLSSTIDLENAVFAVMNFWAKWDIEAGYDYVQVLVSGDGGAYQPLTGKYTKVGNNNQAPGQPVYDGIQTTWVKEEINLEPFLGKEIKIRFRLVSDSYVTGDGFYWDDLEILIIDDLTGIDDKVSKEKMITLVPNPTKDYVKVEINSPLSVAGKLQIYNSHGQLMHEIPMNSDNVQIDISSWSAGIYFYILSKEQGILESGKLLKQ